MGFFEWFARRGTRNGDDATVRPNLPRNPNYYANPAAAQTLGYADNGSWAEAEDLPRISETFAQPGSAGSQANAMFGNVPDMDQIMAEAAALGGGGDLSPLEQMQMMKGYGEPTAAALSELVNMPNKKKGGLTRPKGNIGQKRRRRVASEKKAARPSAENRNLALAMLNERNYDEAGNFRVPRGVKKNWSW